jgi:hypothetical protein
MVAVAQYADTRIPRLPGVLRDAERLRTTLEQHGDGGVYRMHWLCDGKATRQGILTTLAEIIKQACATDQVMLYFAGHGWRDRDLPAKRWRYYLIPYDANFASAAEQGISIEDLQAMLSALSAQEVVVILDCCHSGGMVHLPWTGDVLEDLLQGWRSHYVMAASRGYEQAAEDAAGGFFTQALCDALRGDGVTPDERGRISAQKAWSHAADLVRVRATQCNQQQAAVSSGISSPIYVTCVKRDLVLQHLGEEAETAQQRRHGSMSGPATPSADNLLHLMWDCLDPNLQDAFSLAYNKKRRQGGNRISTKDFFQALARLGDGSFRALIESLPEGALPEPVDPAVPTDRRLVLEEAPLLSDCVEESLGHFRELEDLPRRISPADMFVDIAKNGHGPSVARLRAHGVGEREIEEQVRRLGLSVLRRKGG